MGRLGVGWEGAGQVHGAEDRGWLDGPIRLNQPQARRGCNQLVVDHLHDTHPHTHLSQTTHLEAAKPREHNVAHVLDAGVALNNLNAAARGEMDGSGCDQQAEGQMASRQPLSTPTDSVLNCQDHPTPQYLLSS